MMEWITKAPGLNFAVDISWAFWIQFGKVETIAQELVSALTDNAINGIHWWILKSISNLKDSASVRTGVIEWER